MAVIRQQTTLRLPGGSSRDVTSHVAWFEGAADRVLMRSLADAEGGGVPTVVWDCPVALLPSVVQVEIVAKDRLLLVGRVDVGNDRQSQDAMFTASMRSACALDTPPQSLFSDAGDVYAGDFALSPNGSVAAHVSDRGEGPVKGERRHVWVSDIDGSGLTRCGPISDAEDLSPQWLDDQTLVFNRRQGAVPFNGDLVRAVVSRDGATLSCSDAAPLLATPAAPGVLVRLLPTNQGCAYAAGAQGAPWVLAVPWLLMLGRRRRQPVSSRGCQRWL